MKPTDISVKTPDELEREGHEKIAQGHALLAQAAAARIRPVADELLDDAGVRRHFAIKIRALVEAAGRGEPIEVLRAGRSPRVRRADVERWMAWREAERPKRAAAPPAESSAEDAYLALVERKAS